MSDTDQRRKDTVRDWARAAAPYLLAALGVGGGVAGVDHLKQAGNDRQMLEQHTEALRERVDYLEGWITRHNREHMDGSKRTP